ncbi:hypothetical protein AB4876_02680 [Zhongshania guokunii]|uniref:HEPN domain-containing protein n=1 Tax=Zhongshania guokunii TaxID=641783 RepID=A0ABV3U2U8_9GAMM
MGTVSKLRVAEAQLDSAIDLFLDGKYVASLTLAGAAEEIFGKLVKFHGGQPAFEKRVDLMRSIVRKTRPGNMPSNKKIGSDINYLKNSFKHLDMEVVGNAVVNIRNVRREAISMLDRAIRNYSALGSKYRYNVEVTLCRKVASFRANPANHS